MTQSANQSTPLSIEILRPLLTTKSLGRTVHLFQETTSTNTVAMQLAESGTEHGTIVIAERQTAGRGRHGRTWFSPAYMNLYCSVILTVRPQTDRISWIPLVAGIAVAHSVQEVSSLHLSLKWPNDILIGDRKLGGILCETTGQSQDRWAVVVGIGVNVNTPDSSFPAELQKSATSLAREAGSLIDRHQLLASILKNLEAQLEQLHTSDTNKLKSQYLALCSTLGQYVRVHLADGAQIEGMVHDISQDGALCLRRNQRSLAPQGVESQTIAVRAGDVAYLR